MNAQTAIAINLHVLKSANCLLLAYFFLRKRSQKVEPAGANWGRNGKKLGCRRRERMHELFGTPAAYLCWLIFTSRALRS